MSTDIERPSPLVESVDDLVAVIRAGEKPRAAFRVGTEHEKLPYYESSLLPVPYDGGIREVLLGLVHLGWQPDDPLRPVWLSRDGASITLEPGGQLELSGAPLASVHEGSVELSRHLQEVAQVAAPLGIAFANLGLRPTDEPQAMPWVPKERYRIMRAYLPSRGRAALEMMVLSATVQANFDFENEADMADKMRTAMAISPVVAGLFANSPYTRGRWLGRRSRRYAIWRDVDADRCGLLPFVFHSDFGYRAYVEWALDVPMLFVRRQGRYVPAQHMTFRRFWHEGLDGARATIADFENHLSSLFPEVRLKTFLEVRCADAGPPQMALALAALWKGLLYDAEARAAAWGLLAEQPFASRVAMQMAIAQGGLGAHGRGWHAGELAAELVRLAGLGLERQGARDVRGESESIYVAPLLALVQSRKTLADMDVERYGETLDEASLREILRRSTDRR